MSRAERGGWAAAAGAEKVLWLVVGAPKKCQCRAFPIYFLFLASQSLTYIAIDVSCHALSRPKWV